MMVHDEHFETNRIKRCLIQQGVSKMTTRLGGIALYCYIVIMLGIRCFPSSSGRKRCLSAD